MLDFLGPILTSIIDSAVSTLVSTGVQAGVSALQGPPPAPRLNIAGPPAPAPPPAPAAGVAKAPTALNFSGGFTGQPPSTPSGPVRDNQGGPGAAIAPGGFSSLNRSNPLQKYF